MSKHPMQQLLRTDDGVVRFKANAIVEVLLDRDREHGREPYMRNFPTRSNGGLNWLAMQNFPQEDWEQFYQLIGYSLTGYHELSNVSDASARAASDAAAALGFGVAGIGCRDSGCSVHTGVDSAVERAVGGVVQTLTTEGTMLDVRANGDVVVSVKVDGSWQEVIVMPVTGLIERALEKAAAR